jgi:rubrerythrin
MSYTHPKGQPQGKAYQLTNKLREILAAEIIAINGYQTHIANSDIEEINTAWHSIMTDEKKHYGLILKLLRKYDPEQYKQFTEHKTDNAGSKELWNNYIPEYSTQIILNNIRDDIKGEMEAVVFYEPYMSELPHKDLRDTLHYIINEEKGHAEHLTRLLLKYDPDIYDDLK